MTTNWLMNKHCFRPFSCLRPLQLRKQTNLYLILGPFFIILISYATLSRPAPAYVCVSFFFLPCVRACHVLFQTRSCRLPLGPHPMMWRWRAGSSPLFLVPHYYSVLAFVHIVDVDQQFLARRRCQGETSSWVLTDSAVYYNVFFSRFDVGWKDKRAIVFSFFFDFNDAAQTCILFRLELKLYTKIHYIYIMLQFDTERRAHQITNRLHGHVASTEHMNSMWIINVFLWKPHGNEF